MICNEILTLETISHSPHPNLVTYRGFEYDNHSVRLFVDYVSGGSIASLLGRVGRFDERVARYLVRQVCAGVAHLHALGIVHRDIKGANGTFFSFCVFISPSFHFAFFSFRLLFISPSFRCEGEANAAVLVDEQGNAMLADFGTAKTLVHPYASLPRRMSVQGTVYWMAPEVLRSDQAQSSGYGAKADVWSLGCLALEMVTGMHPWRECRPVQAVWQLGLGARPPIPDVSPTLRAFLEACLTMYVSPPERRLTRKRAGGPAHRGGAHEHGVPRARAVCV